MYIIFFMVGGLILSKPELVNFLARIIEFQIQTQERWAANLETCGNVIPTKLKVDTKKNACKYCDTFAASVCSRHVHTQV
jgi:hypothetical protein